MASRNYFVYALRRDEAPTLTLNTCRSRMSACLTAGGPHFRNRHRSERAGAVCSYQGVLGHEQWDSVRTDDPNLSGLFIPEPATEPNERRRGRELRVLRSGSGCA